MVLDLRKLAAAHQFRLETDRVGTLLVHGLSASAFSFLSKEYVDISEADSMEFVHRLTTLVCQHDANGSGEYTDERINTAQAELLSEEELESFSEQFILNNSYLREKPSFEKRKNEDGEQVMEITNEPRDDLQKNPAELWREYLKRVIHQYRLDQEQGTRKLLERFSPKSLFSDSIVNLIDQNKKISERLGSSINHYDSIKIPELTENPAYETNRQLKDIGAEFSETSRLVKNMNDLGLGMAIEIAASAKTSKRHNTIMIAIGLVTLIFSAIMSYLAYVSSNESARDIQKLLSNSIEKQELTIRNIQTNGQFVRDEMDSAGRRLEAIESEQKMTTDRLQKMEAKAKEGG